MVDIDKAVRKALAEGKTEISGTSAATVRATTISLTPQRRSSRS